MRRGMGILIASVVLFAATTLPAREAAALIPVKSGFIAGLVYYAGVGVVDGVDGFVTASKGKCVRNRTVKVTGPSGFFGSAKTSSNGYFLIDGFPNQFSGQYVFKALERQAGNYLCKEKRTSGVF